VRRPTRSGHNRHFPAAEDKSRVGGEVRLGAERVLLAPALAAGPARGGTIEWMAR